ncbi:hypothetical protein FIA58_002080 [Flavobacterium jejuense]|uniref:Uncharacterized protein n=1 Tax=Flavobacterium jejuense TaxID=1544455 RepID=A0ABX0IMK0_9FLAO|nr:hypothetical protein [Flavobacterium jejuense]NHN24451.1 hypothetical protein [Flavobacterium jejuense]
MKKITLLLLILLPILVFSQSLETKEVKIKMSKGTQTGIEIFIPSVSEDDVEDAIKEITKKYKGDEERVRRSNETYIENAIIKEINSKPITMHQLIEEVGKGIRYTAFFNLGGSFLESNANPKQFAAAEEIVTKIAIYASKIRINDVLEEEKDQLEDLLDDQKGLEDDKDDAYKVIEKAKDEIADKEKEILELKQKLDTNRVKVVKQQKKLDEIKKRKKLLK